MRIGCTLALACSLAPAADSGGIALPRDPKAVVILLEYEGGFRAPTKVPPLEIRRDGSVRVAVADATVEGRLTEEELISLLRFAVTEHRFFEFDPKAVAEEIRREPGDPDLIVEDAATTEITIEIDGKRATKSWHALGFAARRHPKVAALQHLRAIERRLENVVQIVRAGGTDAAKALLKVANGHLRREHAGVAPLELTDLVRFHRWESGGRDVLFEREEQERVVRVSVSVPPEGDAQVGVEFAPPRR